MTVLRARRIAVPDAARRRIQAERDLARLESWLERASYRKLERRGDRRRELTS